MIILNPNRRIIAFIVYTIMQARAHVNCYSFHLTDQESGGLEMLNLSRSKSGDTCVVTWMMGEFSSLLKERYDLKEDTHLYVLQHYKNGDVIILYGDKKLALPGLAAERIKVELAS